MEQPLSEKQKLIKRELTYLIILLIDAILGWFLVAHGFGAFVLIATVLFVLPRYIMAKILFSDDGSFRTWKFGPFIYPYPIYFLFLRDPEKRKNAVLKFFKGSAFFTLFLIFAFSIAIVLQLIMELFQFFI